MNFLLWHMAGAENCLGAKNYDWGDGRCEWYSGDGRNADNNEDWFGDGYGLGLYGDCLGDGFSHEYDRLTRPAFYDVDWQAEGS
jgi:hypothetical protein